MTKARRVERPTSVPSAARASVSRWFATGQFVRELRSRKRPGRMLVLQVTPANGKWLAVAFETVDETVLTDVTASKVFADHAHKVLGSYAEPVAAFEKTDQVGALWQEGLVLDKCGCEEIA